MNQNQEDRSCPTGSKAIWKGKIPGQPERTQVHYLVLLLKFNKI